MDEQQAIKNAAVLANELYWAVMDHGHHRDVFLIGRELAAALEGMAILHEKRRCADVRCDHQFVRHLLNGSACMHDDCPCEGFEEAV